MENRKTIVEKIANNGEGVVTSMLSFVGDIPSENRKHSLVHGLSDDENQAKQNKGKLVPPKSRIQSPSPRKKDVRNNTDQPAVNLKRTTIKKPLQMSFTAPVSMNKNASSSIPAYKSLPRHLKSTGSATAPITPIFQRKTPAKLNKSFKTQHADTDGEDNEGRKSILRQKSSQYPKKVSSEYPSYSVFKNQEGLKFSGVCPPECDSDKFEKGGAIRKKYSATLRQRLLGNSSSFPLETHMSLPKCIKANGKAELASIWLQLKSDIENAMGKKPDHVGQYKELKEIFKQVIC